MNAACRARALLECDLRLNNNVQDATSGIGTVASTAIHHPER